MNNRSAPTATVVPILAYEDIGKASECLTQAVRFKNGCARSGEARRLLSNE
jgi:hypothetical protein